MKEAEKIEEGPGKCNVSNVHHPSITTFLPDANKATGTAIIIAPGGGHRVLCLGHEGDSLAKWFADHGIAAFVLRYRLACEEGSKYTVDEHAMAVITCLKAGDVTAARHAVSMIVGRDTSGLDEQEIIRAVFETVAESLNDGVIAPLFWLGVAGPVGMVVYKAVNTMDSMFGHKSEKYLQFGWAAARMDDLANLIPARLTAGLIWIIAALMSGLSARNSFRITLRDANTQPSPNSGYPESAVAGALGVQFGGVNFYRGVRSEKHFLGDMLRPLEANLYGAMRVIVYGGATLFALLLGGIAQWA